MKALAAIICAGLMVVGPVGSALAREAVQVDGWEVSAEENFCFATRLYDEYQTDQIVSLAISYNAKAKRSVVSFSNTKTTSVTHEQELPLKIFFMNPDGDLDEGWGTAQFSVHVSESGHRFFNSEPLEKQLLDDFSKGKLVAFFTGSLVVSSFALDGSAKAMAELRKCAFEVAGMNPLDPFLR